MIIQCPSCRVLADITCASVEEERAGIRCPACLQVHWLPSGEMRREDAPMALAEQRVREPSLSTAQREELEQDLAAMPAHAEGPDLLHNGFVALLQRWDDEAAHRALLQQADALSQLPALGMRYRTVLQRIPEDPAAKRAQQRIVQLAFASLPVRGEHTSENRPVSVLVMGMVGLFALALSVWYWMVYAPGE